MSTWQTHAWFIVAESRRLKTRPLAVTLQGQRLVLFRSIDGHAHALVDRCPHRNVPLSMGRVVEGQLECAYHGWRFDGRGECVAVPGLVDGTVSLKSRCALSYPLKEQQGYLWVYASPSPSPMGEPFSFRYFGAPGYTTVRRLYRVEASVHAVAENALDVPHTAFLHGGLFRTAKKANTIDVHVKREAAWCEARFVGEPVPKGLIGKLLAPQGGVVEHSDRFELPGVTIVDYRLGSNHVVATSVLTPVDEGNTLVFAQVSFKSFLPGWLVAPFVLPVASRIFAQDAVMLRRQRENIALLGERFVSSELDVLGPQIARLLEHAAQGGEPLSSHEHSVKMKT